MTAETDETWIGAAARWPVAFARVREDPRIDLAALSYCADGPLSVCMIASGGCTAATLAGAPRVKSIHLVDANPAQIALARVKLELLRSESCHVRSALLGHRQARADDTAATLCFLLDKLNIPHDTFGPLNEVLPMGLDHAGRYEALFARLADKLAPFANQIHSAFRRSNAAAQAKCFEPQTELGQAFDAAINDVMALPNLIRLFGAAATRNAVQPFSRHFAGRIRCGLQMALGPTNPFLWGILLRAPCPTMVDWIDSTKPQAVPQISWDVAAMDDALQSHPRQFDFVHLSNILDWLSPEEATRTLHLAQAALKSDGVLLIRQLNSTLDIPSLAPTIQWLPDIAGALHAHDRSYFYRALHLGRRP